MKQFQYVSSRTGTRFGPYDVDKLLEFRHEVRRGVLPLEIGQTWVDSDGDVWSRADAGGEPTAPVDERLERIATAAMAAIINKHPALNEGDDEYHWVAGMVARGAIDYAKALILELDAAK
jgi:hypothetical protein